MVKLINTSDSSAVTESITVRLTNFINILELTVALDTRTNLVPNSSFEIGTTWNIGSNGGWPSANATWPSSDQAKFGSNSVKLASMTTTVNGFLYQDITVTPGHTYQFSGYVFLPSGSYISGSVLINLKPTNFSFTYANTNSVSTTNAWLPVNGTYTANTETVVRLILDTNSPNFTVYWDAILFEDTTQVGGTYFDGSFSQSTWTGSVNGSTSQTSLPSKVTIANIDILSEATTVTEVVGVLILTPPRQIGFIEFVTPTEFVTYQTGTFINPFDSSSITDAGGIILLNTSANTQITIIDFTNPTEFVSIIPNLAINVFDSSAVTENISVSFNTTMINVFETLQVTENTPYQFFSNESLANLPTTGTIKDNATWNNGGWITLTTAINTQHGEFEYSNTLPSNFEINFDFWTGGGSGADAVYFYYGCSQTPVTEDDINCGGYQIAFDEYTPKNQPVQINFQGTTISNTTGVASFADSKWHNARIEVTSGNIFTVFLDNVQQLTFTDTTRTLGGSLFGWGAKTGGASNEHRVRNVYVSTLQPVKVVEIQYFSSAIFDSSTVTDTVNTAQVYCTPIITDGLSFLQQENSSYILQENSDKIVIEAIFDVPTLLISNTISVFEASTATEFIAIPITNLVNVFDSSTVTDVPTIIEFQYVPVVNDSSAVTESIIIKIVDLDIVSDSSTVTESVVLSVSWAINTFDSAIVTDGSGQATGTLLGITSTGVQVVEVDVVNISENSTVTDIPTIGPIITNALNVNVFETSTAIDIPTVIIINLISTSESSIVTENFLIQQIYPFSFSESSTATEAFNVVLVLLENMPSPTSGEHYSIRIWTP